MVYKLRYSIELQRVLLFYKIFATKNAKDLDWTKRDDYSWITFDHFIKQVVLGFWGRWKLSQD